MRICSVEDCGKKHHAKGLCEKHYLQRYYEDGEYYKTHKKQMNDSAKKWLKKNRKKERLQVIFHYSQGKNCCACCGENIIEFLTINHINGGGNKHRKEVGARSGEKFYKWLIKNNFPKGFNVLCMNCNMATGIYGICPHQITKNLKQIDLKELKSKLNNLSTEQTQTTQ
jgi:hypothetical protein